MNPLKCPCCGAISPNPPPVPREEIVGRLEMGSKVFLGIVQRLARRPGLFVSMEELVEYVYRRDPDGGPVTALNCINKNIWENNAKLHPLGWNIESVYGRRRLVQLERRALMRLAG